MTAKLRELTIGQAIELCNMPSSMHEASAAAALSFIVADVKSMTLDAPNDPRLWTVHERAMLLAHYIAHISGEGPDFSIGDGKFSHYVLPGNDYAPANIPLGDIAGDAWSMRPLLGAHAESIERLILAGELGGADRASWWFGGMAAQLERENDIPIDPAAMSDAEIDDAIRRRVAVFRAYPERDFLLLLHAYLQGISRLDHLLKLEFCDDGPVFLPVGSQEQEVSALPPARFPIAAIVCKDTFAIFGKLA